MNQNTLGIINQGIQEHAQVHVIEFELLFEMRIV